MHEYIRERLFGLKGFYPIFDEVSQCMLGNNVVQHGLVFN